MSVPRLTRACVRAAKRGKTEFEQPAEVLPTKSKRANIKIEYDDASVSESWKPNAWEDQLKNIREMRKNLDAPVDTMGCHKCGDTEEEKKVYRFHVLVALMLSSQTKDQVTSAAMERLKAHGLNVPAIVQIKSEILGKLIYPVGFWKKKVDYIKKTAVILAESYDCDIPDTVEGLCKLPGVGPKMAHICMDVAWNKMTGIGVDTHVHRISNRLGWVKKITKQPEETRKELEAWIPRELWREINVLLVGFGQQTCLPVSPKCDICLNKQICPFGRKKK